MGTSAATGETVETTAESRIGVRVVFSMLVADVYGPHVSLPDRTDYRRPGGAFDTFGARWR